MIPLILLRNCEGHAERGRDRGKQRRRGENGHVLISFSGEARLKGFAPLGMGKRRAESGRQAAKGGSHWPEERSRRHV